MELDLAACLRSIVCQALIAEAIGQYGKGTAVRKCALLPSLLDT